MTQQPICQACWHVKKVRRAPSADAADADAGPVEAAPGLGEQAEVSGRESFQERIELVWSSAHDTVWSALSHRRWEGVYSAGCGRVFVSRAVL